MVREKIGGDANCERVRKVVEHPILFSGPMVRAILSGKKTQTRRVVTDATSRGNYRASELLLDDPSVFADPGPSPAGNPGWYLHAPVNAPEIERRRGWKPGGCDPTIVERLYPSVFVGERLWVREAWSAPDACECPETCHVRGHVFYHANEDGYQNARFNRKRPSIHMPRWASRLTLELTEVRVERVQAISEADAIAEGVDAVSVADVPRQATRTRRADFAQLWDWLNADRGYSWESNPWVWCLSYRLVQP